MKKIRKSFTFLLEEGLTSEQAKRVFELVIPQVDNEDYQEKLRQMFWFALDNDPSLFTVLSFKKNEKLWTMAENYIASWCSKYIMDRENPALKRPLKNYGERDSALTERIASNTEEDADTLEKYMLGHFLYMSAENMNGSILEEYLAEVLEPYGWIWCAGATFRAVDFCCLSEEPILLQVKNKYNTENSSSSAIRGGTEIKKWNRLNRPRAATGYSKPLPNWEELRFLVNANEQIASRLSEEMYLRYISENSTKEIQTLN